MIQIRVSRPEKGDNSISSCGAHCAHFPSDWQNPKEIRHSRDPCASGKRHNDAADLVITRSATQRVKPELLLKHETAISWTS